MIDQDSPHHLRGHAKELRAILPAHAFLIDQFEIGLVHEPRRLQRVTRPLVAEVPGGNAVQLRLDNREQILEGLATALAPREEQLRHVLGVRRHDIPTHFLQVGGMSIRPRH